jgi:hypothetical protein
MTDLNRPVRRKSHTTVRDASVRRRIVVTLYPSGVIGLRPEKTRREEALDIEAAYSIAVKSRVAREKAGRKKKRHG